MILIRDDIGLPPRFEAKVNRDGPTLRAELGPCWIWRACLNEHGYGQIRVGPRRGGRAVLAHRVSFCIASGADLDAIDGKHICHKCDNPACVNPEHLFDGDVADNMRDMVRKGRQWNGGGTPGERHGMHKLTESQVLAIRASAAKQRDLAAEYGVSQGTISFIRKRQTWRHL